MLPRRCRASPVSDASAAHGNGWFDEHQDVLNKAATALGSTGRRYIVLVSDGFATVPTDPILSATSAADAAKNNGIKLITIGLPDTVNSINTPALTGWASPGLAFTANPASDISAIVSQLVTDLTTVDVTITDTLGPDFTSTGPLSTSATLANGELATLNYTATHNGAADPFGGLETVSTSTATVDAAPVTITPAATTINVQPCEGQLVLNQTCAAGASCSAQNINVGGANYSIDAGTTGAQTKLRVLSGITVPSGVCSNAVPLGAWALWDIRPLSTGGVVITGFIDKAALKKSGKKWFEVRGCWGTNEVFPVEGGGNATKIGDTWWGTPKTFKNVGDADPSGKSKDTCSVSTVIGGVTVPTVCSIVKNVQGGARLTTVFPYIGSGKYDPAGGLY